MHIQGGYYLVIGSEEISKKSSYVSGTFYSISNCISDVIPGSWGLSWVNATPDDEAVINKLKLNEDELNQMKIWLDQMFDEERFGWPNVFSQIETAREFYLRFLREKHGLKNMKLLGVALKSDDAKEYIAEYKEYFNHDNKLGKLGNYINIIKNQEVSPDGIFLGYEILGDSFSTFCSFMCNRLDKDYHDKLGITLNEFGLISTYGQAQKATEYTNCDESGAEPVFWLPWAIYDYPLEKSM